MFEAIKFLETSADGTTIADYRPFRLPGDEVDITVVFKPRAGAIYGAHVLIMGIFECEGCLVTTRHRQGLNIDGTILNVTVNSIQYA